MLLGQLNSNCTNNCEVSFDINRDFMPDLQLEVKRLSHCHWPVGQGQEAYFGCLRRRYHDYWVLRSTNLRLIMSV